MPKYFATFPAGCYEIIAKQLKSFSPNELKLIEYDESSVIFESTLRTERLIELRFFTNIYQFTDGISDFKGNHFSLAMLINGEPAQIESSERAKLETQISKDFGLRPNTHLAKNNFILIQRSGKEFLTLRLPRPKFKREKPRAGELRPELAHILCLAAGLKAKDTLLDPFAGYGSILLEAVRGFGCKNVIAVDAEKLISRHEAPEIQWHHADARKLDFIEDNSVNRVITDPPWGIFDESQPIDLYAASLKETRRVLKTDGIAVILSGSELLDAEIAKSDFKRLKEYKILVSGKKAKIHKLQKT